MTPALIKLLLRHKGGSVRPLGRERPYLFVRFGGSVGFGEAIIGWTEQVRRAYFAGRKRTLFASGGMEPKNDTHQKEAITEMNEQEKQRQNGKLPVAVNEDVEYSEELADADDREAAERAKEADERAKTADERLLND